MTAVYHIRIPSLRHTFDKVEGMDLIAKTFPALDRVMVQALFDDKGLTLQCNQATARWFQEYFNADIDIGVLGRI